MNKEMFEQKRLSDHDEAHKLNNELDNIEKRAAEIKGKPEADKEVAEGSLSFDQFKDWLEENGLAEKIPVIEEQINDQEKFGGTKFDRSQFFIEKDRLSAIRKGFEVDCINFCEVIDTTGKEVQTAEAKYLFRRLMEPLEAKGFKIWAKTGKERWTKKELEELLQEGVPVEPDEIDARAFKADWVAEETRILNQKTQSKTESGGYRLVFTDSRPNIPKYQVIVNKKGEVVSPQDNSYIETVANNIRVTSRAEKIALASYVFQKTGKYLCSETWEYDRDFDDHRDKKTSPPVSVAHGLSNSGGFRLYSFYADYSIDYNRRRVSL